MKKGIFSFSNMVVICMAGLLLSSCMKDKITMTYRLYYPIYQSLTAFRAQIKAGDPVAIQQPGKFCLWGNFIFLNEPLKGIHVIDNTDPVHPKNVSFINIPGNNELAIQGNALFADVYGDLVSFDISNPAAAVAKNFVSNAFPERSNYYLPAGSTMNTDSIRVVASWKYKDTTVSYNTVSNLYPGGVMYSGCVNCAFNVAPGPASSSAGTGQNGSTAMFCIIDNYLYTVGNSSLGTFDIADPFKPLFTNTQMVDWHVETIYPFRNNLFIGTNNGVYIYDVSSSPGTPGLAGEFTHVRGCDPVIADGNYAYVTLNDSSACLGFYNQLQIVDIRDFAHPFLEVSYSMTHPGGLSKSENLLFIADGSGGLKIYNAADVNSLQLIKQFKGPVAGDIITRNGLAILLARDGLYQYDYSDLNNIHQISKL